MQSATPMQAPAGATPELVTLLTWFLHDAFYFTFETKQRFYSILQMMAVKFCGFT